MKEVPIRVSQDPEASEKVITTGLKAFNRAVLGEFTSEPIAVDVLGESGEVVGGAYGTLVLGWMFVDRVWIPESQRASGVGKRVLDALEAEALRRGADRAILDTMTFQAEGFYLKCGYVECGRVPNFASGYDRVYMTKNLK